jgi:hypothetical protein
MSPECSQRHAAAGLIIPRSAKRKAAAAPEQPSTIQKITPTSGANGSAVKISLATFADDGYSAAPVPESPPALAPDDPPASMPANPPASVPNAVDISAPMQPADESAHCFNCGQDDHCQTCLRKARKCWKQTYYPRTAPYCQPGWGWNQPCWRRTVDTYNCPRPANPNPTPRRRVIPEPPADDEPSMEAPADEMPQTPPDAQDDEAVPEAPVVPRESAARR